MKGLKFDDFDIDVSAYDLQFVENIVKLKQEVNIFLNIQQGECFYDKDFGLSRNIILGKDVSKAKSHIKSQILAYFGDRITEVDEISYSYSNRQLEVDFELNTIYGPLTA